MTLPEPRPGLVLRYAFLWSHEAAQGRSEASKDRPCAVIVAVRRTPDGDLRTLVAPITHEPPTDPTASVELPAPVCRALGLDEGRHWLRCDELNSFAWPGFDLRPVPGGGGRWDYGMLPRELFEAVRRRILDRQKALRGTPIIRD
jgi:hypothetical protein